MIIKLVILVLLQNLEKQNTQAHCTSDILKTVQVTTTIKPKTDTELLKNWKQKEDTIEA